jgi:hypothetical protein
VAIGDKGGIEMKTKMNRREFLGTVTAASATLSPLAQILTAGQKTGAKANPAFQTQHHPHNGG